MIIIPQFPKSATYCECFRKHALKLCPHYAVLCSCLISITLSNYLMFFILILYQLYWNVPVLSLLVLEKHVKPVALSRQSQRKQLLDWYIFSFSRLPSETTIRISTSTHSIDFVWLGKCAIGFFEKAIIYSWQNSFSDNLPTQSVHIAIPPSRYQYPGLISFRSIENKMKTNINADVSYVRMIAFRLRRLLVVKEILLLFHIFDHPIQQMLGKKLERKRSWCEYV